MKVDALLIFVRKRILSLCFRSNELGVCALLLSGGASFAVYSGVHRLVMNKTSVKAALEHQDANHKVTAEIKKLIQTKDAYKEESADDLRFVVAHASDQALPLRIGTSAADALSEIKKNEAKKIPAEFKDWLREKAHTARLSSRSYPVDNLRDVLKVVKEIHPDLDVDSALKTILERSDKILLDDASRDRVDRFRMIAYKEKVKVSTLEMENYLIEKIPPELISKLKDDKQFNKFIDRLPHSSRHWWSATWRWLLNLLVTKKANDYSGDNLVIAATRPVTGVLNLVFFGPIAEPLKLSVDHVSSRFMHRMTGKPWRPGALTHLATTYLIGADVWSKVFLFPFILGPLADKQREESFEEAFEEQILGDDPEAVAKRKELALRVIYDQRFHRYYIDKNMKGEEKQDLRLKAAPIYLQQLADFYEKSKADAFKSSEEYLEHPVFYKEKEYADKGFPLELEETQYLRSMKFNVAGNAYRYKKTPSGDRVKLNPSQLKSLVDIKKEYLLRSEAIFQIKKIKETSGLTWEFAVSKYLNTLPVDLQENFMNFFGATSDSISGKAVAQVLSMGIENGVRDEAGAIVFTVDNNQVTMMLQALANAEMEWRINEVLGRQMNRKRKTASGGLVYENSGPAVSKEQYIGRMPGDMLYIIKSLQESEEQAEAYQSIFERMSESK